MPRSKDDNDDVIDDRRRNAFSATSLSRISSQRKRQTDSFLARKKRAKEESFKKYSKKQPFFQQQKINKKGVNYLDRISLPRRSRLPFPVPSRLCSLYARACVVSGRTVSVLKGEGERKVNTHARCVSLFYKLIPSEMRDLGEGNPFELGESRFIYQIYISMFKRAKKKGSKR